MGMPAVRKRDGDPAGHLGEFAIMPRQRRGQSAGLIFKAVADPHPRAFLQPSKRFLFSCHDFIIMFLKFILNVAS